ncbi:IclR family transcriptional regulator, partial [Paraburkholderia sp. Se-20369]|nr:IclR family transcriptional regulator [Paraburkholderia sp. Se-20369]
FASGGCCYSFRAWHADVNAAAVPFREPREGRWLILSCSGPASSMGEDVFRSQVGPRLKALAQRLGQVG